MTLPEFAQRVGISRAALVNYRDGTREAPLSVLLEVCKAFDVRPEWLLLGRGPMREGEESATSAKGSAARGGRRDVCALGGEEPPDEFCYVPKVAAVLNAGHGSWITEDQVVAYYAFRRDWIKMVGTPRSMVLMEVQGDSMTPTIQAGDHVLIDASQTTPRQGAIMAVAIDEAILVKRINITPDQIELISDNRLYNMITIKRKEPTEIRFLGRIVWLARQLR